MSIPKIHYRSVNLGCDPEFFFKQKDGIIGSEKVIPKGGLVSGSNKFTIDGVQVELNPRPSTCRALVANEIRLSFIKLKEELKKHKGISCDFSQSIEISKEKLQELDEKARKLGCAPSRSVYRKKVGIQLDTIDPEEYRVRSAGGHLHFGFKDWDARFIDKIQKDWRNVVKMLDYLVGNTCVLVDRDPSNIERRKLYGKAGEFRLPEHGLEYRTLSNFWLRSSELMSFVMGLGRQAIQICLMEESKKLEIIETLTKAVKPSDIRDAINNNDFDLALKNFNKLKDFITGMLPEDHYSGQYAITNNVMEMFEFFVEKIQSEGIEYWFPKDPVKYWTGSFDGHDRGFYQFLNLTVREDMKKNTRAKAA